MGKRGLGKGLDALIPKSNVVEEKAGVQEVEIKQIVRNEKQPRQEFDNDKLKELADSIKEHGIIQPILVRQIGNGNYEIIAGERRWRAAKIAGITKVPVVIKDVSEREVTEIALIENIQREDLNPIEEAMAYRQLIDEFGLTQEELSKRVGKSRPFIANSMRLLNLPNEAQHLVQKGMLTSGHARALLALEHSEDQSKMANRIIEKNLTVRQIEEMVKQASGQKTKKNPKKAKPGIPIIKDIEEKFQTRLGTKVRIKHNEKRGCIEIEYYGEDDLQRIIEQILGDEFE